MAVLWADLVGDVGTWTNRPTMVAQIEIALKQAIRLAHKQAKFWRDLVTVTVASTQATIQQISITDNCPRFRQLCYLKATAYDLYYDESPAAALLTPDGFAREDIYWGMGTVLNIRAAAPQDSYDLAYYLQPSTDPDTVGADWLVDAHSDVVVLLAASSILSSIGEQEIKNQVDKFLAAALADLLSDNLEVTGR